MGKHGQHALKEMQKQQPAKDFERLQQEIQRRFESLSPHLQRIGEYALADPNRFALQTIAKSSGECGVQPSTMVRFAKLFGFTGFTHMQQLFRQRLTAVEDSFRNQVREHRSKLEWVSGADLNSILDSLAESSTLAISQMLHELEIDKLGRAVKMLKDAHTIYVLGLRQALPVASCLSLGLLKLGSRCHLLDSAADMQAHHIANATADDLIVAISLTESSRELAEPILEACQRKVPVLAVSTSQTNPLARNATLNLMVRDPEVHQFEPIAPYIVLVQTLVIALASTRE